LVINVSQAVNIFKRLVDDINNINKKFVLG
jgi:hypothetical protein